MLTGRMFSLVFFVAAVSFSGFAHADGKPRHVTLSAISNEQTHAAGIVILREAYRRIGYTVTFDLLPGKRSLMHANAGTSDGDVARIAGTEKEFPNLVPVPTPIILFQGAAFTKTVTRNIENWNDLKGLTVGIIRGIRYSDTGTKGMDRLIAHDMTHLFRLLDRDRVQVAVATVRAGESEVALNFPDSGIHIIGAPVYTAPLYHFVHKKNVNLVPLLDAAIRNMKKNGLLEQLFIRSLEDSSPP